MIVVSDSSALINLARIGRLDLLHLLYRRVVIANAVWNEVVIEGRGRPGADEVLNATWIEHSTPVDENFVLSLQQRLGAGEAESIVLAIEQNADLLIIDESLGRDIAQSYGIQVIGLMGILIESKNAGLIPLVKTLLDQLLEDAHFFINPVLYTQVLQIVREK